MSTFKDDRTADQKATTRAIVRATDKFMSGWGGATGGKSIAAWACDTWEKANRLEKWVGSRSEMKYVSIVAKDWRPKLGKNDHAHVYWVDDNHPALR